MSKSLFLRVSIDRSAAILAGADVVGKVDLAV